MKFGMQVENVAAGIDCKVNLGEGFSETAVATADGERITIQDINNFEMVLEVPGDLTIDNCNMKITELGIMDIQVGANEGQQLKLDIPKVNCHIFGVEF